MKSPTDDTWGFQGCVSQLENPVFRCWVTVAKIEIFNSKYHFCGWCSEPQLWLSLVSTARMHWVCEEMHGGAWMSESAQKDVAFHQVLWKIRAGNPALLQGQAGLRERVKRKGALKQQTLLCAPCHPTSTSWGSPSSWQLPSQSLHQTSQGSRYLVILHLTCGEQTPLLCACPAAAPRANPETAPHSLKGV